MIEHAGVGFYETDRNGRIRFVNRTLAHMFGYASAKALLAERPVADVFYADPGDIRRFRDDAAREGSVRDMAFRALKRDGSCIWVKETGGPVRDASGAVTGYAGTLTDVTELIEARNRLEEAEAGYRRIFERASEGIYRSTLDGQQLRANPALAKLNGYESEDDLLGAVHDIGREWYVDPGRREEFRRRLDENGVLEGFVSEVYRHRTRERIWISENAYVVYDPDGKPLYYEGTVRDITHQKKAEAAARAALDQAESANRAKSRFLAHMSHELRTPLNAILGFSDMLRSLEGRRLSAVKVHEYAGDIHSSGRLLLDLINDILDLSRIESDAVPLQIRPTDAAEVIEAALVTIRPMAEARSIALDLEIVAANPVLADRRAVLQCLLNVLSNAVKYSDPGGRIHLRVEPRTQALCIIVADDGAGIPAHQLARIGEPFNTGTAPHRSSASGTGLGLAITKALVTRMNGAFVVESEVGRGTRVTIQLPAATTEASGRAEAGRAPGRRSSGAAA